MVGMFGVMKLRVVSLFKMAHNVRVLGEEADKQDHIPDVSKMVTSTKQTLN